MDCSFKVGDSVKINYEAVCNNGGIGDEKLEYIYENINKSYKIKEICNAMAPYVLEDDTLKTTSFYYNELENAAIGDINMPKNSRRICSFANDWEKMYDFWNLTKEEFLNSYSYLTEEEYNATCMSTVGYIPSYHDIPNRDGNPDDEVIAIIPENKIITKKLITNAETCLIDNGVDEDEVDIVLQALGYILLDTELFKE